MLRVVLIAAVLLAFSGSAAAPVFSQEEAPRPAREGIPGLESTLSEAVDDFHFLGQSAALERAAERGVRVRQDRVQVTVEAVEGREAEARAQISAARGVVEQRYGRWLQVSATLPQLEEIAAGDAVKFVSRTRIAEPQVVSEGVALVNADDWHAAGYTGEGVKIAIIDLGFSGYSSKLGTELPASVTTMNARSDGIFNDGVHGTAVAEIVYDMAPDAEMYLIAVDTDTSAGIAVDYAIAQGIDVISMSLAFLGSGTGDGTGPINDVVDEATDAGIMWVNSAGNYADEHWSGPWTDTDADDFLNFQGVDETNQISLGQGQQVAILLLWDDPWDASCNDYDLWVLNNAQTQVVGASLSPQDCSSAPPGELVVFSAPNPGTYHILVERFAADGLATFDLFTLDDTPEWVTAASSVIPPADNPDAVSVGAVPHYAPGTIEYFSSQGPTNDGRLAPRIAGPDRTSGTVYGTGGFAGTSASAPHVAGAAALVFDLNPCFNRQDVQSFLEDNAIDYGDPGDDNVFGTGTLDLPAVPTTSCATPTPSPSPTPVPPDLIVTAITTDPVSPLEWETIDVTVTVQNVGAGLAGPFAVDFYKDLLSAPAPSEPGDYTCQSAGLDPGLTYDCQFTTSYLDPGTFDMWAQADTDDEALEAIEGNNVSGPQAITVNGAPDADGDSVPDFADNCDLWPNPAQAMPSWPVPADDDDCDGFTAAREAYVGTEPDEHCTTGPASDAWPPDFDLSGAVDILDVLTLKPAFGGAVPPTSSRYDLNEDAAIDILDVLTMKAFFMGSCTPG